MPIYQWAPQISLHDLHLEMELKHYINTVVNNNYLPITLRNRLNGRNGPKNHEKIIEEDGL